MTAHLSLTSRLLATNLYLKQLLQGEFIFYTICSFYYLIIVLMIEVGIISIN